MKTEPYIIPSNFPRYKWRFAKDKTFVLPFSAVPLTNGTYRILSQSGNTMVQLAANKLTIFKHYHFDGATHAYDFKSGLPEYAKHDAMCRLAEKYPQITRKMADQAFNPWASLTPSPLHLYVYYPFVRLYAKWKGLR